MRIACQNHSCNYFNQFDDYNYWGWCPHCMDSYGNHIEKSEIDRWLIIATKRRNYLGVRAMFILFGWALSFWPVCHFLPGFAIILCFIFSPILMGTAAIFLRKQADKFFPLDGLPKYFKIN